MGDLQVENGDVMEDRLLAAPSFLPSLSNPDPFSISDDTWDIAEETTQEVVGCIHPTLDSEERRKDVIEYVQRLIRCSLGCEVFPYGSVPLKTYLPDGDIDLTALSMPNVEESLARNVLAVLQVEVQNENAEYEVKDTQFVDAEVKLVKCLVQNIVIDISFNQLGGLCTLCFLEQVDRLVRKDHLFKRSIILIKAWCYYESRILGAHHGLISTYALETLVLYIFHLFDSSLNGPLAVLYRFLDYFSRFDWENYCISLDGPVCKASLPDIVVEKPENGGNGLMLSEEFLRNCIDMFSVPARGLETNLRAFPLKHLNIIDPLKESNNLGRSVHRGNFFRIRSAFRYGARKLGRILLLPRERVADEMKKFFTNTIERHGNNYGLDIQNPALIFGAEGFGTLSSSTHNETFSENGIFSNLSDVDFDDDMSGVEHKFNLGSTDGSVSSGHCLAGDANDIATFQSLSLRSANETSDCSPRGSQFSSFHSGRRYYAPHFYFSGSSTENGNLENGNLCQNKASESVDGKIGLDSWLDGRESHLVDRDTVCLCINDEHVSSRDSAISSQDANVSDGLSLDFTERVLAGSDSEVETVNPLSDLSGDYDSHIRSLLYGQCIHGYALSAPVLRTSPPASPSQFQNKKPCETICRSMPLKLNSCSQVSSNGAVTGQPLYPTTNNSTPSSTFVWEGHRTRGTGTYFPYTNFCSGRERPSRGRRRNRAGTDSQLRRHAHSSGLAETNPFSEDSHALLHAQSPSQNRGKSGLSRQSHHPTQGNSHQHTEGNSHTNGFSNSQRRLEFGSFGPEPEDTSYAGASTPSLVTLVAQSSEVACGKNQERIAEPSFHLKNEDEFPPLSASIS